MLTPPDGFSDNALVSVLAANWWLDVAAISYNAVGFGSHHWDVTDATGARWFITVDELQKRRQKLAEPLDAALERLKNSLGAAFELRASGCDFVIAPVPSRAGELVVLAADEFAMAVYPFVAGESFEWGDFSSQQHRQAALDLVVAVHQAPPSARELALADNFAIQKRDELEAALEGGLEDTDEAGPYTEPMLGLVSQDRARIRGALGRFDELVGQVRAMPSRSVLTHGEPHAGNTMLTNDGWRLIDWDTALVAPPERDLWMLDTGDGSVLASYTATTGVQPVASVLELYRARWDLTDVALEVSRFLGPHKGTEEDEKAWQILVDLAAQIGA